MSLIVGQSALGSILWPMLAQIGWTFFDVVLRGRVFMINFLAATVLVGHVALLALEGVGR